MKAVLKDGTEIECDKFDKVSDGTYLYKNEDQIGFIPLGELRAVAPDAYEPKNDRSKVVRRGGKSEDKKIDGT
ncbi:hypothetical protein [Natronococcus sp. A-GB7]|uniref:hypothetical protein n=1 Tax=Natronococcus sp. A-GB7 TaxID=3037649 RepID=UPI00241E23E2|nr:hypothetical protein [Natronococcus sp. A-GB7]MDG5821953.1 hypothetical protein [Natronococcus sp. A-GB7]